MARQRSLEGAVAGVEGNITIAADKKTVRAAPEQGDLLPICQNDLGEAVVEQCQRGSAGRVGWELRCGSAANGVEVRRTIRRKGEGLEAEIKGKVIELLSKIVRGIHPKCHREVLAVSADLVPETDDTVVGARRQLVCARINEDFQFAGRTAGDEVRMHLRYTQPRRVVSRRPGPVVGAQIPDFVSKPLRLKRPARRTAKLRS